MGAAAGFVRGAPSVILMLISRFGNKNVLPRLPSSTSLLQERKLAWMVASLVALFSPLSAITPSLPPKKQAQLEKKIRKAATALKLLSSMRWSSTLAFLSPPLNSGKALLGPTGGSIVKGYLI